MLPCKGVISSQLRKRWNSTRSLTDSVVAAFPLELIDFRRTLLAGRRSGSQRAEGVRPVDNFVLFDLAGESILEPIASDSAKIPGDDV